jgi:hypothetical protein
MGKVLQHFLRSGLFLDKIQMRTIEKKPASKFAIAAKVSRATKTAKTNQRPFLNGPGDNAATCTARLKPLDAERLRMWAHTLNLPLSAMAGVVSELGGYAIREEETASFLRRTSVSCLWGCINREAGSFTEIVPMTKIESDFWLDIRDAENLNRKMEDWQGTLVNLGLEILQRPEAVKNIVGHRIIDNFAKAYAYDLMNQS